MSSSKFIKAGFNSHHIVKSAITHIYVYKPKLYIKYPYQVKVHTLDQAITTIRYKNLEDVTNDVENVVKEMDKHD
jgi:hypothetical protein